MFCVEEKKVAVRNARQERSGTCADWQASSIFLWSAMNPRLAIPLGPA